MHAGLDDRRLVGRQQHLVGGAEPARHGADRPRRLRVGRAGEVAAAGAAEAEERRRRGVPVDQADLHQHVLERAGEAAERAAGAGADRARVGDVDVQVVVVAGRAPDRAEAELAQRRDDRVDRADLERVQVAGAAEVDVDRAAAAALVVVAARVVARRPGRRRCSRRRRSPAPAGTCRARPCRRSRARRRRASPRSPSSPCSEIFGTGPLPPPPPGSGPIEPPSAEAGHQLDPGAGVRLALGVLLAELLRAVAELLVGGDGRLDVDAVDVDGGLDQRRVVLLGVLGHPGAHERLVERG